MVMTIKHWRLLWQKEWQIFRNTFLHQPKQVLFLTLFIIALVALLGFLLIKLREWLAGFIVNLAAEINSDLLSHLLVIIVLSWLTILVINAVISESKRNFFQLTDLHNLLVTPVKPWLLISFRFFIFSLFSFTTIQHFIFGFVPLLAIGAVFNAPWFYYPLILPVTYLFLLIPVAIGLVLVNLLLRFLSARLIFGVATFLNITLGLSWLYFLFGDNQQMLISLMERALAWDVLAKVLYPLTLTANLIGGMLNYQIIFIRPLVELIIFSLLTLVIAVLIIQKIYYRVYDRLQCQMHRQKKANPAKSSKEPTLLVLYWKMAFRNYEMAKGVTGFGMFYLGYLVLLRAWQPSEMMFLLLLNIGVVGLMAQLIVVIMLQPAEVLTDYDAAKKQYWILKSSPFSTKKVISLLWQIHFWPQLIIGGVGLLSAHLVAGIELLYLIPVLLLFSLIQALVNLLQMMAILMTYLRGYNVSWLEKVLREGILFFTYPLIIFILGLGSFYQRFSVLSFLHSWTQRDVFAGSMILFLALLSLSTVFAFKKSLSCWERLEL